MMVTAVPITVARPTSWVPAMEWSPILNVREVRLRSAPPCVLDLLGSRPGGNREAQYTAPVVGPYKLRSVDAP